MGWEVIFGGWVGGRAQVFFVATLTIFLATSKNVAKS